MLYLSTSNVALSGIAGTSETTGSSIPSVLLSDIVYMLSPFVLPSLVGSFIDLPNSLWTPPLVSHKRSSLSLAHVARVGLHYMLLQEASLSQNPFPATPLKALRRGGLLPSPNLMNLLNHSGVYKVGLAQDPKMGFTSNYSNSNSSKSLSIAKFTGSIFGNFLAFFCWVCQAFQFPPPPPSENISTFLLSPRTSPPSSPLGEKSLSLRGDRTFPSCPLSMKDIFFSG